jgi:hypothetical protein
MTNVFTLLSQYPRYESHRSQYLSLQLQSPKMNQNQTSFSIERFKNSLKDNHNRIHLPLSTTYTNDYKPWSQSEMKASRGQNLFVHDKVAESSVPELPAIRMSTKRYSLNNVTLPIPTRCCCTHSKQCREPCLTQVRVDYWKNLSCCGVVHEDDISKYLSVSPTSEKNEIGRNM